MSMSKTLYPRFSTGSTQKDKKSSDIKHQHNKTNKNIWNTDKSYVYFMMVKYHKLIIKFFIWNLPLDMKF